MFYYFKSVVNASKTFISNFIKFVLPFIPLALTLTYARAIYPSLEFIEYSPLIIFSPDFLHIIFIALINVCAFYFAIISNQYQSSYKFLQKEVMPIAGFKLYWKRFLGFILAYSLFLIVLCSIFLRLNFNFLFSTNLLSFLFIYFITLFSTTCYTFLITEKDDVLAILSNCLSYIGQNFGKILLPSISLFSLYYLIRILSFNISFNSLYLNYILKSLIMIIAISWHRLCLAYLMLDIKRDIGVNEKSLSKYIEYRN